MNNKDKKPTIRIANGTKDFKKSGVLEILCQSDRIYSKGLNNESNTWFNRCTWTN